MVGIGCRSSKTADPSASLGMTKGRGRFDRPWLPVEQNRRSLGFARDEKGEGDALIGLGCRSSKTAGPSTALRCRVDNSVGFRRDEKRLLFSNHLHGSFARPFVIPSEAEGSAVQWTFLGKVLFYWGKAKLNRSLPEAMATYWLPPTA